MIEKLRTLIFAYRDASVYEAMGVNEEGDECAQDIRQKLETTLERMTPTRREIPPPMAGDNYEVCFVEGWNACCDEFFSGGFDKPEAIVIEIESFSR